jgi:rare lipoprotein A
MQGNRTASGEVFRTDQMTAASKTLPLGSILRVTNPSNGRSVVVRINDRGPYVYGRSLDLSPRAARQIGIMHEGVANVKITVLHRGSSHGSHPRAPRLRNVASSASDI